MIEFDLLKHKRLEAKRNPMYEGNKVTKIILYISGLLWAVYLLMFGALFPSLFTELFPAYEPYHVFGNGVVFIWALDILIRFLYQKPPSAQLKPYILLPIGKNRIINMLMIDAIRSLYNLVWLFLVFPFAFITVLPFYGFMGVLGFVVCFYVSILINALLYMMFRSLMAKSFAYVLLPIVIYGLVIAGLFLLEDWFWPVFVTLGDLWASSGWLMLPVMIVVFILVWLVVRKVELSVVYSELASVEKPTKDNVTDYTFFDRLGDLGEYMKLEMKMVVRNKNVRNAFLTGLFAIVVFVGLLLFTDMYSDGFMNTFALSYIFSALGIIMLSKTMSFEGNYIDCLMIRKVSLLTLIKAKYYLHCIFSAIALLLTLPIVFKGDIAFSRCFALYVFNCGVVFAVIMQLVVYNKKTTPLNDTIVKGGMTTGLAEMITMGALFLPMLVINILDVLLPLVVVDAILMVSGLVGMLTSGLWLRNIYNRFNRRKYQNLEGLRATRP